MMLKFVLFFFSGEKKVEDITAITTIEANLFPDHNQNEYFLLLFMSTFFCQIMNVLVLSLTQLCHVPTQSGLSFQYFWKSEHKITQKKTILTCLTVFFLNKIVKM